LVGGSGRSRFQLDERLRSLAAIGVLDADHRHFLDTREAIDRLLDAARIDVVSGADDEVLDPVHDEDEPVLIHDADVAGSQVLAGELIRRLLRSLPIPLHHLRALDADLPLLTERDFPRWLRKVAQRHDRSRERLPDRAFLDRSLERVARDAWARFGEPVALD